MTSSSSPNSVLTMDGNSSVERSVIEIKPLSKALEVQPVLVSPVVVSASSVSEEKGHSTANGGQRQAEDATSSPLAVVVTATDTDGAGSRPRARLLLRARDKARQYLPGQPRVSLDPAVPAPHGPTPREPSLYHLPDYLRRAHLTTELDRLLPFMKYIFVQTPSHRHIMPLHHQPAHGRDRIIVDEHPGLHLVWYYERIYIKPIPAYMYSQEFWTYAYNADPEVYRACLGFVRSYYHLIQYEIDFDKACELKLIPKVPETARLPTYEEFCAFVAPFGDHTVVRDEDVSRRFQYGELRLSRINKTTMLVRRKFAYFHIYPQWGSYLSHIIAPVVTVFAFLSVIFNALQVTLAAHEVGYAGVDQTWHPFLDVAVWFPIVVMVAIAVLLAAGIGGIVVMGLKDLIWAKSVRERKKQGDLTAGEKAYGVVW
ncbi:hypothetical protein PpBr36_07987 [Pyricularia pennisetigena]|uniref:hypothetical protein n=1 Tax=Pyricularia pennisetigena TaxID=1578925 RepID=UPI00115315A7|nr:hypothetical protein PpBr36_07987 [Pyricularia pennisetigena]TLS23845.1 hypothetical protein PpBr36_07987 [Pyricularia pennisetigena]